MDTSTLLLIAAVGGMATITAAYADWRMAVKFAFVLVLFEGAIRKWILPQASEVVYFAKDAVLVGAYLRYYVDRTAPWTVLFRHAPVNLILAACVMVALSALHPNIGSWPAAVLGVKNYVIYVPLFFLAPQLFLTKQSLFSQLSAYCLFSIPICLLGLLQWRSDAFSVLNTYAQGTGDYGATTFGTSTHVRITGTFSYLTGHTVFVASFWALCMAMISSRHAPFRKIHALVSLPLLAGNAFMSGSRAAVVAVLFCAGVFFVSPGLARSAQLRRALGGLVATGIVCTLAALFLFPEALEAARERFERAGDSLYDRTIGFTLKFTEAGLEDGGLLGYGVGATSPAVANLTRILHLEPPETTPVPYDYEMGQVLLELGLLGFLSWYTMRSVVLVYQYRAFLRAKDPDLKPLILASFCIAFPYVFMSLVLNHVAGLLVWGLSGFSLLSEYRIPDK
jgi:hypothetical protein